MRLYLGNASVLEPKSALEDGSRPPAIRRPDLDGNPMVVECADSTPLLEVLRNVESLWDQHSDNLPAWVAAENPTIAQALSAQFVGVPVRDYSEAESHYNEASGIVAPSAAPEAAPAAVDPATTPDAQEG